MSLRRSPAHPYPGSSRLALLLLLITLLITLLVGAAAFGAKPLAAQDAPNATPGVPAKATQAAVVLPTKPPINQPTATPTLALAAPESGAATRILTDTTSLPAEPTAAEPAAAEPGAAEDAPGAVVESVVPPAAPPIDYTPTFVEIDCPFVVPWSQTIICGNLTVPEVRADPDSAQIAIFVMILKSQAAPLTDPIVVLPGGPGGAGSESRTLYYGLPSHRNRDLILIDPRGAGHSYPSLDCFEMNAIGITHATSVEATRACYTRLVAEGRNLAGYVSSEQVQDVADLAKVLGFGKINLYATSYGTRVAVLLADRYPALVRSMVLDGVLPVAVNSLLEEPLNDYGVIQRIAQDCVAEPRCNGSFPALEARLLEVIDRYNRTPLPDDIGYGAGDDILKFIFKQMYAGGAKIPAFITALYDEEFAQACALLPPAVGCFFVQQEGAEDGITPYQTVPTEEEAMLGIDFLEPEISRRGVITWERISAPRGAPVDALGNSGTTAAPLIAPAVETVPLEAPSDVNEEPDADLPPWRAHFVRPEDPLGPDLDRISWLMHDRGFFRPADLFAWLDGLSEAEVAEMLRTIPDEGIDVFSEGVYASVMCAEEAPFYSLDDIALLASRIPQQFGSLPTRRAHDVKEICAFWEVPAVSAARKMTLPSSVPALITNGTHDAVTPAVWAERAAIYLDNVWLRLFPGFGHAILSTGDLCMQEMMANFYTNPQQDPTPPCYRNLRVNFVAP